MNAQLEGREPRPAPRAAAESCPPEEALRLGRGLGWRGALASFIAGREELGFVEVVAENLPARGPLPRALLALRDRGLRIIPHGISLSLGGAQPPGEREIAHLACIAERLSAPLVSEHICFVRAEGLDSGHLLPLPRNSEALDILLANVALAKDILPVPLALENIATLFEWPEPEMDEPSFIRRLLVESDCALLMDVSNLYANARNFGFDFRTYLDAMPLERIAYVHLAGGTVRHGLYHDTHAHAIPEGPYEVLEELFARCDPPGVMIERDDNFPPPEELSAELAAMTAAMARGAARRAGSEASLVS